MGGLLVGGTKLFTAWLEWEAHKKQVGTTIFKLQQKLSKERAGASIFASDLERSPLSVEQNDINLDFIAEDSQRIFEGQQTNDRVNLKDAGLSGRSHRKEPVEVEMSAF